MANVMIKLLQPWIGTKDGRVRLQMGHEESMIDESRRDKFGRAVCVPGKVIDVVLYPEEGKDEVLVPEEWSRLYFGDPSAVDAHSGDDRDWRIVRGQRGQSQEQVPTRSEEADRVALNWGDFRKESGLGKIQGINMPPNEPIGPPQMPHVLISLTDAAGRVTGATYDPWEFLGYNERWPDYIENEGNRKLLIRM